MRLRRQTHVSIVAAATACLVLAGCGAAGGAAEGVTVIGGTTYITISPTTTTLTPPVTDTVLPAEGTVSDAEQSYTVEPGDSLYGIAGKFEIPLGELVELNEIPEPISGFLLTAGQTVLRIPPGAIVASAGGSGDTDDDDDGDTDAPDDSGSGDTATSDDTEPDAAGGCTHTIAAGEWPESVAGDYGISLQVLQQANTASGVMTHFRAGETLIIPAGAECPG